MLYEVKKGGVVKYTTVTDKTPYTKDEERSIQSAGYEIYIDGKKRRQL